MFLLLDCNTQWCHILLSSDALLKFLNPTPGPSTKSTAAASTSNEKLAGDVRLMRGWCTVICKSF